MNVEEVRKIQAALVDEQIALGARKLTDAECKSYMKGDGFRQFAFVGVKNGVLYGREA